MATFENIIKGMLDERAAQDALFATTYAKPNKSFDKCISYIFKTAREKATNNSLAVSDDEVLSWAIHYYDEDDIDVKATAKPRVEVMDGDEDEDEEGANVATSAPKVATSKAKVATSAQKVATSKNDGWAGSLFD